MVSLLLTFMQEITSVLLSIIAYVLLGVSYMCYFDLETQFLLQLSTIV